jgi:hypothetical protein
MISTSNAGSDAVFRFGKPLLTLLLLDAFLRRTAKLLQAFFATGF